MLDILFQPLHEEFHDTRAWVGPGFEPERFDLGETNDRLARVTAW